MSISADVKKILGEHVEKIAVFGFYFLALLVLALFGLHKFFILRTFRKHKHLGPSEPPNPRNWPAVTVQLPVFNERYVIKRLLKAVVSLDYPRDKLHIQVLDDSTDSTKRLTNRLAAILRKQGYWIDVITRSNRTGFKAGALAQGLQFSPNEYLAIFDADFVPRPEFLKKTIPYLLQEGIGMVQTRWGHINKNYSMLTRLQSIFLDAHFLIEHVARNRSGRFINFNGTAGIWRRQAIMDAGGWQHDTLTEDLDLSYRAQLNGWKFIFLPDVVSPAELPVEMNAYRVQQYRWSKGSVQTALKLIPTIWRSDFPFFIRLEAIIHLSNNFAYLMMAVPAFLMVPVVKYTTGTGLLWPIVAYLIMFITATLSVIIYYGCVIKESHGRLWPDGLIIPLVMALGIGLSLNNGRAALAALFRRDSEFKRTPKFNIISRTDGWRKKVYRAGRHGYLQLLELMIAFYFTYGLVYFLSRGFFLSFPFFLLFQAGFFYISISSLSGWRS